jgi:hypothetical protein
LLFVLNGVARADTHVYVIAIGNNAPPSDGDGDLAVLHYADDDAAAFYTFTRDLAVHATLLTVLDTESQRRYASLAEIARPPTLSELRNVVRWHRTRFEEDRRAGHDPVLLFFYSGHGSRAEGKPPSLALLDGALTQAVLYEEILAALPARYVHLIVDACHAEAIVRPRDAQAETVDLSRDEREAFAERSTLARFPHVGAIIAAASAAQAHEWDVYQMGVFSHELLSGLRGAADVNGDHRIEYSELSAFLTAANREVSDPRARLAIVVHPPAVNRRAPLVDLSLLTSSVKLVGAAAGLGAFYVEDAQATRLADVRAEPGWKLELNLPPGTLYLHSRDGEAELHTKPGARVAIDQVKLASPSMTARGSMDAALRRGLFAEPFGPTYYRGFVDRNDELVAVPFAAPPSDTIAPRPVNLRLRAGITLGAAAGLTVAAAVLAGLTLSAYDDFNQTQLQREATRDRERYVSFEAASIGVALGAGIVTGVGTWLTIKATRKQLR